MHLRIDAQPLLLQVAVWACVVAFAASSTAVLCINLLVLSRTGVLVTAAGERALGWGERAGRKASRMSRFLVAEEFRSLRRLWYAAWAGALASFGVLFLILAAFGERT